MEKTRIQKIIDDIESYNEAIDNAEGALAEAERELEEELSKDEEMEVGSIEDYPEYNKD